MKRSTLAATITVIAHALTMSFALEASAQLQPSSGPSIVKDPEWQKRFLGSYGFLSGAEPEIKPSEIEILREVIDLMQVNTRAAAAMLEQRTGSESSAVLDFILANLRFQNGETEQAAVHYSAALAKFPDFRRAHKNLGLLRVQLGDHDAAVEHLARAIELGDRDGRTYGLLGYCHLNRMDHLPAEAAYRNAILHQPDSKDWYLGLARSLLAQQRHKEAIALFSGLLAKDPEDDKLWKLQANAYLGLDQPMEAATNLEAVRVLGKADSATLVLLGDIYMNQRIFDLAKELYLEVIRSDDGATGYRTAYRAADLLHRSQAHTEAAEILESIDQRYAGTLDDEAELELMTLEAKVARAQGQPKKAAGLLERIVARDGTRGDALLELARYHRDQGNDQKALLLIERARNLERFEYDALVEHAQLHVASRDYEKAASLLRQALRIQSEPRMERYLARIEEAIRR